MPTFYVKPSNKAKGFLVEALSEGSAKFQIKIPPEDFEARELPPIGSKVYIDNGWDRFECEVLAHNPDGTIKVFEPGYWPKGKEHTLSYWDV